MEQIELFGELGCGMEQIGLFGELGSYSVRAKRRARQQISWRRLASWAGADRPAGSTVAVAEDLGRTRPE
ncbi:unnamed protein product [Citrullus colocynthis]|uniref:Uncharacterized protein n=1 Tax=Citrullus colocynthis TaxID=252529 RepID=A0ABP0Z2R2_9ROSI